jgi:hypothetical protein
MSPARATKLELGPCPSDGKLEGKIHDAGAGRFPWFVMCQACSWSTEHVRNEDVAVKLWNEALPETKTRDCVEGTAKITTYSGGASPVMRLIGAWPGR